MRASPEQEGASPRESSNDESSLINEDDHQLELQPDDELSLGITNTITEAQIKGMSLAQQKKLKIDNLPTHIQRKFIARNCKYLLHRSPSSTIDILDQRLQRKYSELANMQPLDLKIETEVIQRLARNP